MPEPLRTFEEVVAAALAKGEITVAVAAGHDPAALEACALAEEKGLGRSILVGEPALIEKALAEMPKPLARAEVVAADGEEGAAAKAVELVREGKADTALKGKVDTATFMKAVLDGERGLRTDRLISDEFVFEYPDPDVGTRLVCITDGGIIIAPTLEQKKQIVENAVALYHALGFERPRVALLSMAEKAVAGHQPSEDAVALTEMNKRGEIAGCVVEGPLSLDLSISMEAVRKKGYESEVAGRADILVVPEIVSGNLLAKATTYFARYRLAHAMMGTARPVLIPSRSDTAEAKFHSLALCALVC
ncbi:MAG: phosphate acyltransferase [bacterium]